MKVFSRITILCFLVSTFALVGKASATAIFTTDFPTDSSTRFNQLGSNFWNDGDFIEQLFSGTGLSEVNEFTLDLSIVSNVLSGDTQDMSVMLNGIEIGDFMISAGDALVNIAFNGFNVMGMGGSGDDYLVRLETTRTVNGGQGSAGIANNTGNLTLTQVSEPGVLALLLVGGLAAFRRQK
ncbi:MAG: hypothetical protein Alis3KO_39200 [Aliiglaciecola sp.]